MGSTSGRHSFTCRAGVQGVLQERDGGGTVGHGMVHLRHDRQSVVGQPLDDDDLPQRTVPGQRPARYVGHDGGELSVASRFSGPAPRDMSSQVEIGVFDPRRVSEAQWHRYHASTEGWEPAEPVTQ